MATRAAGRAEDSEGRLYTDLQSGMQLYSDEDLAPSTTFLGSAGEPEAGQLSASAAAIRYSKTARS
jgi:hypothetical protein